MKMSFRRHTTGNSIFENRYIICQD